jgi:hypothetical protein
MAWHFFQMYPTRRNFDGSEFVSLAGRITGDGSSVTAVLLTPWGEIAPISFSPY